MLEQIVDGLFGKEDMMKPDDDTPGEDVSIDFTCLPHELRLELESAFPEAELVATNAFSGKEVVSLLIDTSASAIKSLADLFDRWKKSGQVVDGKIGDVEFSIKGFDANDASTLLQQLRALIKESKK